MKTLIVGRKVLGPAFRIAIFILLFAAGSVRGFETWEHRKLGDDGYRIAAVIALAEHPDAPPEFRRNVLEYLTGVLGIPVKEGRHGAQLSPSALEPSQVTYGNVAALPDYEKEPESLWDNAAAEHEMGRLDMIVLGRIVRNTTTRGPINISGFYVAHSNSNHFGARGLNEYDLLHRRALALAPAKLWLALFFNAYADHFLQDYCAPGHIMTVRDGVEDQLSLAMHDLYSQMGLVYESANLQDMRSLAARLRASLDKLRSGSAPFAGVAANLEKTLTDASNGCRELEAREAEFEKKDGYVRFFGDGRLIKRDGTEIEAHAVQRQFVTFVTARSALDVLEAYFAVGPGDRTNTFVDNHWEPAGAVNVKTQLLPFSEKWKMTKRGYLTPGLDGPEAVIHYGSYDARDNFPAFAFSVLTLSAGYQSLLAKGSGSDRGEFGVESLLFVNGYMRRFSNRADQGATYEYLAQTAYGLTFSNLQSSGYHANGLSFRVMCPVSQLDMRLSPYFGYRRFQTGNATRSGANGGLRFEIGFGFLYMSLSGGWDKYPTPTALKSSPMINFSLSFGMPSTRWTPN